ncbi:MAG: hypothetical protein NVS1B11_14380 [Terriglobales bacterium]
MVCLQATPAAAYADGYFERTLTVNGSVNLDISAGSGNIQVRAGSSSQVEITGRIKVSEWFGGNAEEKIKRLEANPPIQQSGNDIRIGHIDDPELRHNVPISYELIVPAESRLNSHTGSGNQTIEAIHGPIEIESGSGNLKISEIGETVRADTGSGNIDIDHVKGNVRSKTGSGSIRATDVAGGFEGSTGSGSLNLEQTSPGAVRVSTGSGGLDLRGLRGSLEARAGSGTIRADGEPTGGWFLNTGSGSVRLRLAAKSSFRSECSYQLRFDYGFPAHYGPRHGREERNSRQGSRRRRACKHTNRLRRHPDSVMVVARKASDFCSKESTPSPSS